MMIIDDQTRNELLIEASREGYRAYIDGFGMEENPYNTNSEWDFHVEWKEGYYNAAWED